MYNILLFLHVTSALLLGTFVIFPFLTYHLTRLSGPALEGIVDLLLRFIRVGHYALLLLLITGGGMISQLGTMPSILWMIIAIGLLVIIGAVIGMMSKRLKQLQVADKAGKGTVEHVGKIKVYSWFSAFAIVAALLIMTNPGLLS